MIFEIIFSKYTKYILKRAFWIQYEGISVFLMLIWGADSNEGSTESKIYFFQKVIQLKTNPIR